MKKEAGERFDKEFPQVGYWREGHAYHPQMKSYGPTSDFVSAEKEINQFLDQLIDTTIKQTLEGVDEYANGWNEYRKELREGYNKLAKGVD